MKKKGNVSFNELNHVVRQNFNSIDRYELNVNLEIKKSQLFVLGEAKIIEKVVEPPTQPGTSGGDGADDPSLKEILLAFIKEQREQNAMQNQKIEELSQNIQAVDQKFDQKIDDIKVEIKNVEQKVDQKINNLEEKFNQKIDDVKNEIKNVEQKVDDGFSEVNKRLDKIENCPTIKKELAEQEKESENQSSDSEKKNNNKMSSNDKEEN